MAMLRRKIAENDIGPMTKDMFEPMADDQEDQGFDYKARERLKKEQYENRLSTPFQNVPLYIQKHGWFYSYENTTFNHGFFFSGEPDGSFIRCAVNVEERTKDQDIDDDYVDETEDYGDESSSEFSERGDPRYDSEDADEE